VQCRSITTTTTTGCCCGGCRRAAARRWTWAAGPAGSRGGWRGGASRSTRSTGPPRSSARPARRGVHYLLAEITATALPAGRYDCVACLASLHHLPFTTVAALRQALAPGGVLLVLGCYRQRTAADYAVALAAAPLNLAARLAVAALERARGAAPGPKPPIAPAAMTLRQVREEAARLLPGCTVRRLLFWRYLLVFRRPRDP
jgi:SAM-dependent methyltransferase